MGHPFYFLASVIPQRIFVSWSVCSIQSPIDCWHKVPKDRVEPVWFMEEMVSSRWQEWGPEEKGQDSRIGHLSGTRVELNPAAGGTVELLVHKVQALVRVCPR